jgi:CHAT domain-containing protein/Tfp pilus assembly protein PilF
MGSHVFLSLCLLAGPTAPAGVVVEEVQRGFAADEAGLRPGDVLHSWDRAAGPPANPEPAHGTIASPFELSEVEREQAPRGLVTVSGTRDGSAFQATLSPDEWRLKTRPPFDARRLEEYERGKRLVDGPEFEAGLSVWRELTLGWREKGDHGAATWLGYRAAAVAAGRQRPDLVNAAVGAIGEDSAAGDLLARHHGGFDVGFAFETQGDLEAAAARYRAALDSRRVRGSPTLFEARLLTRLGDLAQKRGDLDGGERDLRAALAIAEALAPESLAVATVFQRQGIGAALRGSDLGLAEACFRRALDLQERLAPESEALASTLTNLGSVASLRGDLALAEEHYRRSLAIKERRTPQGQELTPVLNNLGIVAFERGDLAAAEAFYMRALEIVDKTAPGSLKVAVYLGNLGPLALQRGDVDAAEDYTRRALAIREKLAPGGLSVAFGLDTLGAVLARRGDPAAAEEHMKRALAIKEKLAPDGYEVAHSLRSVAEMQRERGDTASARDLLRRSAAILDRLASRGPEAALTAYSLGDLALAGGDLDEAEAHYRRALEIRQEITPGTAQEAQVCERLAALERQRNDPDRAIAYYRCALDALDAQRGRLGGTDEVKARFGSRYAGFYRRALGLLVERGRAEEAFHVLERYRARALLALMSERDLLFSADLAPELDRERRTANVAYDRALARLADPKAGTLDERREAVRQARLVQTAVDGKIRSASPRLAMLQYPDPLDLGRGRAVLDPGTLLLSYSIGEDKSHLFAVGPGPADFSATVLDTDLEELRREVEEFRMLLQRRRPRTGALRLAARRLSDRLLAPVAERIRRAERVLVVPDGPLHVIPFAGLADPSVKGTFRYLVEAKPVSVAASLTVFAELAQNRRAAAPRRLVAFGDPDYSTATSRLAGNRPLQLTALPATRSEVRDLVRLYAGSSQAYLGAEATEARAKAVGRDASLVHFACHGLADSDSPLESSLVLTVPARWQPGEDNGLLQAWEIFEQVRIDADLVTLSACGTALGREASGEGLLGLSRAFQYAGARSVLASLWEVGDESTGDLMRRVYGHLKNGRSKDRALQAAQVEMIRETTSRHPYHWAAFQILGDWR